MPKTKIGDVSMRRKITSVLTAAVVLGSMGTAFAADVDSEKAELNTLKERLAVLESKIAAQDKKINNQEKETKALQEYNKNDFKIGGDARLRYIDEGSVSKGKGSKFDERFRLTMEKRVNDNASFFSRWVVVNNNRFGQTGEKDNNILVSNAAFKFNNFMNTKNLELSAGRFGQDFGATQYLLAEATGRMDGVKLTQTTDKLQYTVGYADLSSQSGKGETIVEGGKVKNKPLPKIGDAIFAAVKYDANKDTSLYGSFIKEEASDASNDYDYRGIGVKTKVADNLNVFADYARNYAKPGDPAGFYSSLRYKTADTKIPKSFEFRVDYRDIKTGNMHEVGLGNVALPQQGYKGPGLSFIYIPVENTRVAIYQTFNTKDADTGLNKDEYTRAEVTWKF